MEVVAEAWPEGGGSGRAARHGTHVASVIFGQHDGPVPGVSPGCSGLSLPVFSDEGRRTSQLELARGIELAAEAGAHVINISGGQLSSSGVAEDLLDRAVGLCRERNILLVAAAGNDGCFCDHVPAALPWAVAVGASDDSGRPLPSSNWGPSYAESGILAPGENILGAVPGGTVARASGSSLATAVVSGVAGLLLSLQLRLGRDPDPAAVRVALLDGADPCPLHDPNICTKFLGGTLNVRRAMSAIQSTSNQPAKGIVAACECGDRPSGGPEPSCGCGGSPPNEVAASEPAGPVPTGYAAARSGPSPSAGDLTRPAPGVVVSEVSGGGGGQLVYALGTLGYDFGTEARRDSFKQLMVPVAVEGPVVPANPYDARQMAAHLEANPPETRALIWTLNLELTPIYAIEPVGAFAASVYELLARLLAGETVVEDDEGFIERVSVPGRLCGRTVRLFSGQVVPVVEVEQVRGLYGWQVNTLLAAATEAVEAAAEAVEGDRVRGSLREFLTRVYYDLRNLGAMSRDRALNFAVTNAFQAARTFAGAVAAGMALDTIGVEKSPFCRMDSDCWDVKLRFFDPENSRRARRVFRFTIDVSDLTPVTLGEVRTWTEAG
jgi:cyanobactin maturation PatA/PatG family protease